MACVEDCDQILIAEPLQDGWEDNASFQHEDEDISVDGWGGDTMGSKDTCPRERIRGTIKIVVRESLSMKIQPHCRKITS